MIRWRFAPAAHAHAAVASVARLLFALTFVIGSLATGATIDTDADADVEVALTVEVARPERVAANDVAPLHKTVCHCPAGGHDHFSHAIPSPRGHRLANGLRAPLRC